MVKVGRQPSWWQGTVNRFKERIERIQAKITQIRKMLYDDVVSHRPKKRAVLVIRTALLLPLLHHLCRNSGAFAVQVMQAEHNFIR